MPSLFDALAAPHAARSFQWVASPLRCGCDAAPSKQAYPSSITNHTQQVEGSQPPRAGTPDYFNYNDTYGHGTHTAGIIGAVSWPAVRVQPALDGLVQPGGWHACWHDLNRRPAGQGRPPLGPPHACLAHQVSLPPPASPPLPQVGNNALGIAGLNWKVKLLVCRFIWNDGSGYVSDAMNCIKLCRQEGAMITSNSWGGIGYSSARWPCCARCA